MKSKSLLLAVLLGGVFLIAATGHAQPNLPDLIVNRVTYQHAAKEFSIDVSSSPDSAAAGIRLNVEFALKVNGITQTRNVVIPPSGHSSFAMDAAPFQLQPGTHLSVAVIDPQNLIREKDLSNNTLKSTFVVPSTIPDLFITSLSFAPGIKDDHIIATIHNSGAPSNTPPFVVGLWIEGEFSEETVSFPAGATVTHAHFSLASLNVTRGQTHAVTAFADLYDSVFETDEENNKLFQSLFIP